MAPPVELRMDVHCYKCVKKIRDALGNLRGVKKVSASPEQGLVVVHGTALDAYALRRRLERKMERPVTIVAAPYYRYPATMAPPHYGPPQPPAHAYYAQPPPHAYYPPQPPPHAYYGQPPAHAYYPPQPPAHPYYGHPPPAPPEYRYGAGWSDPDPYYGYAEHRTEPTCSIRSMMCSLILLFGITTLL